MSLRRKLLNPFAMLGMVAVIGTVAGLGFGGVFDSGGSENQGSTALASTSASAPTPAPAPNHALAPALNDTTTTGTVVEPDPNFEEELRSARISTRGWKTDFSRHTVRFSEIFPAVLVATAFRP